MSYCAAVLDFVKAAFLPRIGHVIANIAKRDLFDIPSVRKNSVRRNVISAKFFQLEIFDVKKPHYVEILA
jgi:hypothetical protein